MRKILLLTIGLVLCLSASVEAAMTYGAAYYQKRVSYLGSGYSDTDPLYLFMNEVETTIDGTSGVTNIIFTPGTAPASTEGSVYYDSSGNWFKGYNGSSWVTFASAAGNTLDSAYDLGSKIDVDGDVLELEVDNGSNNSALHIDHDEATNDNTAVLIENAADAANAITIDIDAQTTGRDIEGTGATWYVSGAGLATFGGGFIVSTGDALFDDTYDVSWDTSRDQLLFEDNAVLGLGGAHDAAGDVTFKWNATNLLIESAAEDTGEIQYGSTNAIDVAHYGNTNTNIAKFNANTSTLEFNGYDVQIQDADVLAFGDSDDFRVIYDGSGDDLDILGSGKELALGVNDEGFDVIWHTETSGDNVTFDESGMDIDIVDVDVGLDDDAYLQFGSSDDIVVKYTGGTNVLAITQTVADTGTITSGADGAGIDWTFYGEEAGDYLKWDGTGASQLILMGADSSGTLMAITGNDATGNTDTVTINGEGTGDALQITCDDADSVALNLVAAASQTTSLAKVDAATSNWDGADDIGMLHIVADDPVVHTGASLLQVIQSGQPIAASEGHLARFVSSGTARTDAYAVEIETTNTTPALYMNNQMSISAADSAGTLFDITAIDTTGNSDTMTIAHSGTGAAIQITSSEADTQLVELISAANQTTWLQVVDGAAGNWIGADDVGMLHLKADTALADAGASQLQVVNTAQPIASAEGFLARFVDTGTARTDAYAVEIEVTATTGGLYSTGHSTFEKGCQVLSQSVTATADGLTTGLIPDHASFVTVTSDNADKVVVLPTWVIGHHITVVVPATGCEIETLAASNDTINTVDCDGTNQLALTAAGIYHFWCVADSTWIASGWAANGTEGTLTPDAD
ncbi:MAG: hypothetical protein ACYTBJ_24365 [Planctomycetota bacterium]|jgi:hypothetical protein